MKFFTLGLPSNPDQPIYGLYQPVLDCFLAITDSETMAKNLKFLLSPRYSLHVVQLNHAENYQHNIIDNTVCDRWTMSNKGDARLTISMWNLPPINAQQLVEKTSFYSWNVEQEKEYIQMCLFFINFFDQLNVLGNYSDLNTGLDMIETPQLDDITHSSKTRKQVLDILYFERNYDSAYNKIISLVDLSPGFNREFNSYLSKYS